LVAVVFAGFKSRAALQVENLALRHQLGVPVSFGEEAETDRSLSAPVGVAMRSLMRLAFRADHRSA
jgi:hypothetical protein